MRYDFSLYFRASFGRPKLATNVRTPSKTRRVSSPTVNKRPGTLSKSSAIRSVKNMISQKTGVSPVVIDYGMKLAYETAKAAYTSLQGTKVQRSSNAGKAINSTSTKETQSVFTLGSSKAMPKPYAQSEVVTVINKRYLTSQLAASNGKWGNLIDRLLLSNADLRTMSDTYFPSQVVAATSPGYNEGSFYLKELLVDYTIKSTSTIEQELWIYDITPRYFLSTGMINSVDDCSLAFCNGIDFAVGTATTGDYIGIQQVPTAYTVFDSPAFLHWWTICKITRVKLDPGAVHQHKKKLYFNSKVSRQLINANGYMPGVSNPVMILTKGGLAYNSGTTGGTGYEAIVGFDASVTEHYKMASLSNSLSKTYTNIAVGTTQITPVDVQENDANASNAENLS